MPKDTSPSSDPVLVIGLGRFGYSVAMSLTSMGHEILAVDEDASVVQRYANEFTQCLALDSTDTEALQQIGAAEFSRVVVGIGSDLEASVMTVLSLAELGITEIWAKAVSRKHASILERVGAHHVVRPESDMGERVAHKLTGAMIDFMQFDDDFAIARTRAVPRVTGKQLGELDTERKYGVTVLGVKRPDAAFEQANPQTTPEQGDELIVSGPKRGVEAFCGLLQS